MNVLIDLDGTLTDSKRGIIACIQHALRSLGHEVPDESALTKYVGPPLHASFHELLRTDKTSEADRALAAYRERFVDVGMFENDVYPHIPEALQLLRSRGARLFVATSKPRVYAERILDHFQLSHYFDAIHGSELDGRLTDKVHLIAHAISTSNLAHSKTTMIGDRHHDAVGALSNGVKAVGVLWGYGSRDELSNAGVEMFLEAPSELGNLMFKDSSGP
jgi:phosphoglycolate phosphatase